MNFRKANIYFAIFSVMLVVLFHLNVNAQIKTQIELVRGGDPIFRKGISRVLTQTVQEMNKAAENKGDITSVKQFCTDDGFRALEAIVTNTGFYTTAEKYSLTLISTPSGNYEARGITGRVYMGETKGNPIQELVFVINWQGFITNVHFAMENHHYQTLLSQGIKLKDQVQRKYILDFLEQFRTAHNTKDIKFLEKTYSDDALIIVGRVVKTKKSDVDPWSNFNKERIEFIKKSKTEYIEGLRSVFKNNSFVKVSFDSVKVVQHPKVDGIYGINLKQRWNSSNYSDEGYLFVMMDFRAKDTVLVRVRSWQPEKFKDGSVIDLNRFIVESAH